MLIEHHVNDLGFIIWLEQYMNKNWLSLEDIGAPFAAPSGKLIHHDSYIGTLLFYMGYTSNFGIV